MSGRLLLDDPPLVIQPQLAVAIGLNEAIVLQQIHYWLEQKRKTKRVTSGTPWTYNTVPEWCEQFPFWSERTIWQTLKNLREAGLLLAERRAEDKRDRTLWYTIDYKKLDSVTMQAAEVASPISQKLRDASLQKLRDVYKESETSTETSTETYPEQQESPNGDISLATKQSKGTPSPHGANWYMATYNELKPKAWKSCEVINPHRAKKLKAFRSQYQDRAPEIFKAALIFAQRESWWSSKNLSFDTLFNKNNITEFAEGAMTALQNGTDPASSEFEAKRQRMREALGV